MSDWEVPQLSEVTKDSTFIFSAHYSEGLYKVTAFHRPLSYLKMSAHQRQVRTFEGTCRRRQISSVWYSRQRLTVAIQGSQLVLYRVDRAFDIFSVEKTPTQLCALLARLYRQHEPEPVSEAQVWHFAKRWGIHPEKAIAVVRGTPSVFVSPAKGHWYLTPWVRLNVAFQPQYSGLGTGPNSFYETNALQFWLLHNYAPSPEEEWNAAVIEAVTAYLSIPTLPRYFFEQARGQFLQDLPSGKRRLGLKMDDLPEGRYFSVPSPQGPVTYSVEGRAFLMDGPYGVSVINAFATLRMRELLSNTGYLEVLEAGQDFLDFCTKARISAV